MRNYIKLLRIKHYVKNLLIFIPLFFGGGIFDNEKIKNALWAMFSFCCISSAVYILNDLKDAKNDRNHPVKKNRPIANGSIKTKNAVILLVGCVVMAIAIIVINSTCGKSVWGGVLFLLIYFGINALYSCGLKNKPIIDIILLTSGFIIRIFYGAFITDIQISEWLYLVVISGSLYMALGKRRNEMRQQKNTREVLKYYTFSFLDKNMYVCAAMVNIFYALWAMEFEHAKMLWSIPVFMIILMKYSLNVEKDSDGDPIEILLQDKIIIVLGISFIICVFVFLYFV